MADEEKEERGYRESADFVPNPFDQYGSATTNGLGGHFSDLRGISPIFAQAHKNSLKLAAKALDPDDFSVPAGHVILPTGAVIQHSDPEAAKERVLAKAAALEDDGEDEGADDSTDEDTREEAVNPYEAPAV